MAPNDSPNSDEACYTCDACGENIVIPIDGSAGREQEYVEDCPVCCWPDEDGDSWSLRSIREPRPGWRTARSLRG
jgi:hypothetical protein